jgi:hypothetical protein
VHTPRRDSRVRRRGGDSGIGSDANSSLELDQGIARSTTGHSGRSISASLLPLPGILPAAEDVRVGLPDRHSDRLVPAPRAAGESRRPARQWVGMVRIQCLRLDRAKRGPPLFRAFCAEKSVRCPLMWTHGARAGTTIRTAHVSLTGTPSCARCSHRRARTGAYITSQCARKCWLGLAFAPGRH